MTARVVRDRERGGHIALDPLRRGELVTVAPISPPLMVLRARRRRSVQLHLGVASTAGLVALALTALKIAEVAEAWR